MNTLIAPSTWTAAPLPERLAWGLAQPFDGQAVVDRFKQGEATYGDVSWLNQNQRALVLDVAEQGRELQTVAEAAAFAIPVRGLRHILSSQAAAKGHRPQAGWRLLGEVEQHLASGMESAALVDDLLQRQALVGVNGLVRALHSDPDRRSGVDGLLTDVMTDPRSMKVTARYLAERSKTGQDRLEGLYGGILQEAKTAAAQQLLGMSVITGLRPEYQQAALERISRVTFGAADSLLAQDGRLGKHDVGQLRIQLYLDEFARTPNPPAVRQVIYHELAHAGAAHQRRRRAGLAVYQGQWLGTVADEAYADFLSSMNLGIDVAGAPQQLAERGINHALPTAALQTLWEHYPRQFAALYNALYGQVDSVPALAGAVAVFQAQHNRLQAAARRQAQLTPSIN